MSETPQFHPEIEKALVTSGEDIGRVKDVELAHDIAVSENAARDAHSDLIKEGYWDKPQDEEKWNEQTNKNIRHAIAKRAVNTAAGDMLQSITVSGVNNQPLWIDPEKEAQKLADEAKVVGEEYDTLQRAAERGRQNR